MLKKSLLRSAFPAALGYRPKPSWRGRSPGPIPAAAHSLLRLGTGPSLPWLGRSPGRASTGHSPYSGSPTGLLSVSGTPRYGGKSGVCLPALRFPAALGRPGQTLRGLPVRRTKGPVDPWPVSGSPVANPLSGIKLPRSFIYIRFAPGFFSSQRKKRGFCSAPFFKHLRVRKMCGASVHRASRLPKIVFQEPASR